VGVNELVTFPIGTPVSDSHTDATVGLRVATPYYRILPTSQNYFERGTLLEVVPSTIVVCVAGSSAKTVIIRQIFTFRLAR